MQITVKAEDVEVNRALAELSARMRNMRPVMQIIGEVIRTSVERNFAASGRPEKWAESGRVKRKGGQTLSDTGRLRRSFTVNAAESSVAVGTNVIYAAMHQSGGTLPGRTATLAFNKSGRFLSRGDASRRRSGAIRIAFARFSGATMPARPFLLVQPEDWTKIKHVINEYIIAR
jgi:phage virion morphogenesis protein